MMTASVRDKRIILKSGREVTERQALGSPYNQLYIIYEYLKPLKAYANDKYFVYGS